MQHKNNLTYINVTNLNGKLVGISKSFWENDFKAQYLLYKTIIVKRFYKTTFFIVLLTLGGDFFEAPNNYDTST